MKILLTIISLFLFSFTLPGPAHQPVGNSYYFANAGSNSNAGTIGAPWATLDKLSSVTLGPGDHVYLKRGDVFTGPLTMYQEGSPSAQLVFDAYGSGPLPVVTGFQSLTSWTNISGNIWQASLNAGAELNMVTVGGVPVMRGRYPNTGWLTIQSHNGYTSITDPLTPSTNINWTNAWLTMRSIRFQLNSYPITGHTTAGVLTYNGNSDTMQRQPIDGHGYFIQNDSRTLDQQNEWYYSPSGQYLQMYSTSNPGTLNVQAATKDNLLLASSRSWITVQNIAFTGSNILSISWTGGQKDTIRGCEINYSGLNGVFLNFNTFSSLYNSKVYNTNNTAVKLLPDATGSSVLYCDIQDAGTIPGYAMRKANGNQSRSGIFGNGNGVLISHNTVRRTGYAGISATRDAVEISYNVVDSATLVLDDVGGVYHSDAPIYGAVWKVIYNTITNCMGTSSGTGNPLAPGEGMGVYDDEAGNNGIIDHNNISGTGLHAIFLHDVQNIIVTYNKCFNAHIYSFFASHDALQPTIPIRDITHLYNTYVSTSSRTSRDVDPNALFALATDNADFNDILQFGVSDYNTYIKPFSVNVNDFIKTTINTETDSSYTLAAWQARSGQDLHSKVVYSNAYPAYSITSAGASQYPSGNFNTSVSNLLNEYSSTQTFTRDVTMMDTACLKVTYTGSTPNTGGMSVWFYDSGNAQDWPAGTYIIDFDIQNSVNYEAQFYAVIRSANGSQQSQVLKFKVPPYRKHVQLVFNTDHTILSHYFVIYPDRAASAPVFWVDNLKERPATVAYINWRDYMDFKVAGSSPVQVNTAKAYLNEKRQQQGIKKLIAKDEAEYFFTDPANIRIQGVVKPVQ